MSTYVVTGGTGFIGWNLCARLLEVGHEVRGVVRPSSRNPLPEGVTRLDAALRAEEMAAACAGADVLVHLAGLTRAASYERFLAVNAEGARQAAIAARDAGAFLVLVSSMAAGGPGTAAEPARESDPPAPVSDYGRSKLAGEEAARAVVGLRHAVVRPPGVYGPRDTDFLALFRAARRGVFPLLGSPETAYTLLHVDDMVRAIIDLAGAGRAGEPEVSGEVFYVGHPQPVRQADLAGILAGAVGRRVRTVRVPRVVLGTMAALGELQARTLGRPALLNRSRYAELTAPGFVCDVAKIEAVVGHRAHIAPQAGFEATARWYAEHGLL